MISKTIKGNIEHWNMYILVQYLIVMKKIKNLCFLKDWLTFKIKYLYYTCTIHINNNLSMYGTITLADFFNSIS